MGQTSDGGRSANNKYSNATGMNYLLGDRTKQQIFGSTQPPAANHNTMATQLFGQCGDALRRIAHDDVQARGHARLAEQGQGLFRGSQPLRQKN